MKCSLAWGVVVSGLAALFCAGVVFAAEPATPVNLVRNAGFEDGEVGKLPTAWGQEKEMGAEGTVALSDKQAHSGTRSVCIEHTNDKGYIHPDGNAVLKPDTYLYRLWAFSDADSSFTMELYDARAWAKPRPEVLQFGRGLMSQTYALRKDTWTRCEMAISVTEACPVSLQIGLRTRGRLWLDDVELVSCPAQLVLADTGTAHPGSLSPDEIKCHVQTVLSTGASHE